MTAKSWDSHKLADLDYVQIIRSVFGRIRSKLGLLESTTSNKSFATVQVQKALVVASKGRYVVRHDFPLPTIAHDEVMVQTHFVGLNPIDWKSVEFNFCLPEFPWVTGREMSGVVTEVGADVSHCRVGDWVWTSTYYRDRRAGCFQENVVAPAHTVMPIPRTIPLEAAACLGVAALTAAMTLWKWLEVPKTSVPISATSSEYQDQWLLIWGGSAVTGQFATQLARLGGVKVLTVCSAETRAISIQLGATCVITRDGKRDEDLISEIRKVTQNKLRWIIDLVGPRSVALGLEAASGNTPVSVAPLAMMSNSQDVPANVTVQMVEMKCFVLDSTNTWYADEICKLLEQGKLVLPEVQVLEGGLEAVPRGLDLLKQGKMKGKKLVVQVR